MNPRRAALILPLAAALSLASSSPPAAQDVPPRPQEPGVPPEPGEAPVIVPPKIARRPQQEPIVEETGAYIVNLDASPEGVSLEQLIQICQRTTGRTFTYKQDAVSLLSAKVKLLGAKRIPKDPDRFYAFFQTILRINDFVCIEVGARPLEIVVVTYLKGADRQTLKQQATYILPGEIDAYADKPGTLVNALVPLQNLDAQRAATNLRTFFPDQTLESINQVGNSNSLLITGFGPTVASLSHLLELIDVPTVDPEQVFEVISLEHASAQELEPILRELLERRRTGGGPVVVRGAEGPTAPLAGGGGTEETKILTDVRTNSLLVLAYPERMPAVKEMIARLDSPIFALESNFHVYEVKNTDAEKLADTLKNFLGETQSSLQQQQQAAGRAAGGSPAGVGQTATEQRPVIVAEPISNSLLITAGRTRWDEIRRLIDRLDRRQPQVLIETALVELSSNDVATLGVELGSAEIPGVDERKPFGFTSFGLSTLEDLDGDGIPDFRTVNTDLTGATAGILDGENFAIPVLLNALRSRTDANILSRPSVVVNNNEEATVTSTDEIPVAQVQQAAGVGQSSGFGGFQPAGITLSISPSISLANYLRLNVSINVSKFSGLSANPNLPPPRTTREIRTSVYLPSGSTMVVGGIVVDDHTRGKDSIPLLGDIPILGYLFSSRNTRTTKTTLYFFVTPRILRDEDFADLAEISYQRKIDAFELIGEEKFRQVDPNFRPPVAGEETAPGPTYDWGAFDIPLYRGRPSGASSPPETRPANPEGRAGAEREGLPSPTPPASAGRGGGDGALPGV